MDEFGFIDELEIKARRLMAEWDFNIYKDSEDVVTYYSDEIIRIATDDELRKFGREYIWTFEQAQEHLQKILDEQFDLESIRKGKFGYHLVDLKFARLLMEVSVARLPEEYHEKLTQQCQTSIQIKEKDEEDLVRLIEADVLSLDTIDAIKRERFGSLNEYVKHHRLILYSVLSAYSTAEEATGVPHELDKKEFWNRFVNDGYKGMYLGVHRRKAEKLFLSD